MMMISTQDNLQLEKLGSLQPSYVREDSSLAFRFLFTESHTFVHFKLQ